MVIDPVCHMEVDEALTRADMGIAIGSGTDAAIESGDIVLIKDDVRDIVMAIDLSNFDMRKIKQYLFRATGYNVFAIPLAAGVLAGKGVVISPAMGAVLMSLSTIVAIIARTLNVY